MRRLAFIGAVAALCLAFTYPRGPWRRFRAGGAAPPLFSMLSSPGTGVGTASDICSGFGSSWVGNYLCYRGADGTYVSASMAMVQGGTAPRLDTQPECTNGADCSNITSGHMFTSTSIKTTVAQAIPTGNFSVCELYRYDSASTTQSLLTGFDNIGAHNPFAWTSGGQSLVFRINDNSTTGQLVANDNGPNVWNFGCVTYQYGAASTSVMTMYLNGTQIAQSTGNPSLTNNPSPIWVNINGNSIGGNVRYAIYSETLISPATQVSMYRTAVPAVTSVGTPLTFARASSSTCQQQSSYKIDTVATGQPCVSGYGIKSEGAATNAILVSEQIDNASWTKASVTVTADQTFGPSGTNTADIIDFTATPNSGMSVYQNIPGLSASTNYVMSVWLWTAAGTKTVRISRTDHTSWATATVSPTLTVTTTPQRFSLTYNTAATSPQSDFNIGGESKTPFTPSAGQIYAWGAQHEIGTVPSSYIQTLGTSATRVAENLSTAAGFTATSGCFKYCLAPNWTGNAPQNMSAMSTGGGNAFFHYLSSGASTVTTTDNTSFPSVNTTFTAFTSSCYREAWGSGTYSVTDIASSTSASAALVTPSVNGTLWIGSLVSGGTPAFGYFSNITANTTATGCP